MRAQIKKKHANCLELEKKTSEQNLVLILFAERMERITQQKKEEPMQFHFTSNS